MGWELFTLLNTDNLDLMNHYITKLLNIQVKVKQQKPVQKKFSHAKKTIKVAKYQIN